MREEDVMSTGLRLTDAAVEADVSCEDDGPKTEEALADGVAVVVGSRDPCCRAKPCHCSKSLCSCKRLVHKHTHTHTHTNTDTYIHTKRDYHQ